MTRQEKIRKGMEAILRMKEMTKVTRDAILEQQLKFLKSEGMVLKVEGELPSITNNKGEFKTALEYKKDIIKADLTAYEEMM